MVKQMNATAGARIFMTNTMINVVFFLGILSVQLIFSLMISDVDEKTYEYGMMRSLGLKSQGLISLVSLQTICFIGPGLIFGLLAAFIMNTLIRFFMFKYSLTYTTYGLSQTSILLGCLLGILMPAVTNVIPIQKAMGKNLRTSLDLNHRSVNELVVVFKRMSDFGFSLP